MDRERYRLDVRPRSRPKVGYAYIITHLDHADWREELAGSYSSQEEALNAGAAALRRILSKLR